MADIADRAAEQNELMLEIQLANAKVHEAGLRLIGKCHYCEEPLKNQTFCDADCRDDYEKYVRK